MSIRVMSQVWAHSKMKGSSLLLLLAIADFADDAGRAFPSVLTLAEKIRMSERQTRNLLRLLETEHEVETTENDGPHGVNVYRVRTSGGQSLPPEIQRTRGATQRHEGGNPFPTGGQPIAPEPSVTVKEPSVEPARVPRAASEVRPRTRDAASPPTDRELAAIEVAFQRAAAQAWSETARHVGNPYTTKFHLRQVGEQAVIAIRWEAQSTVLDAIRASMEAASAPIRIPEWARVHGAAMREREHNARKMADRAAAERVVVEQVPGGEQVYMGHVPVIVGSSCSKCGKGVAAHTPARRSDLRPIGPAVAAVSEAAGA